MLTSSHNKKTTPHQVRTCHGQVGREQEDECPFFLKKKQELDEQHVQQEQGQEIQRH
jgi:hypothetical protein